MTCGTNEAQYENVCKDAFASLGGKLDVLDVAIRGNGKPGINTRLDRLEQDGRRLGRLVWLIVGASVTSAVMLLTKLM